VTSLVSRQFARTFSGLLKMLRNVAPSQTPIATISPTPDV
jgi:hypothetical protein